jgi:hypothetical protein
LETVAFQRNSDGFVFDNQFLAQAVFAGFNIGEISCPAKYFEEGSSINFYRSLIYGLGVVGTSLLFVYARLITTRGTIFARD